MAPTRLARLSQWSSFGERALLNRQLRFAGVRATSAQLKCLAIDKQTFEDALGPLQYLLPRQNYSPAKPKAGGGKARFSRRE